MKQNPRGFTLIELLVVIAIIAILAALLVAGLHRSKSAADSTMCRSNLRQLGLGLKMYVQQEGAYPPSPKGVSISLTQFVGAPFPQVNNAYDSLGNPTSYLGPRQSVFACPGYNRARGLFAGVIDSYGYNQLGTWGGRPGQDYRFGLGIADWLGPEDPSTPAQSPKRENQVVSPSETLAIGDAVLGQINSIPRGFPSLSQVWIGPPMIFYTQVMLGQPADGPIVRTYGLRHGAKWNMGFCDGHVENLRPKELFDLSRDSVARRWNIDHEPHNTAWDPPR